MFISSLLKLGHQGQSHYFSPSTDRGSGETYVQAELIDELPSTKLS